MQTYHTIGYDSQYNPATGYYEYCYVRMNGSIVLRCRDQFHRGDAVAVARIDSDRYVIELELAPNAEKVQSALVLVSPGFPLDVDSRHTWRESRCKTLLVRKAHIGRNATYIIAALAPIQGQSSITGTDDLTGDVFHFFVSERRH